MANAILNFHFDYPHTSLMFTDCAKNVISFKEKSYYVHVNLKIKGVNSILQRKSCKIMTAGKKFIPPPVKTNLTSAKKDQ